VTFSPITRLRGGQLRIGGPMLIIDIEFFCFPKLSHLLWDTPRFVFIGWQKLFML